MEPDESAALSSQDYKSSILLDKLIWQISIILFPILPMNTI